MGCRKSIARLTPAERTAFVNAVKALKASGKFDTYKTVHAQTMDPGGVMVHGMPLFFPWHRKLILEFEKDLQAIDASVSLPYWDWTVANLNPTGTESLIWRDDFMGSPGSANPGPITGPFAGWVQRNNFDPFQFPGTGGQLATALNETTYGAFQGDAEGPHGAAHVWVGGDMGDVMTSPGDPTFFLLHCNVDRLWAEWIHQHHNDVGFVPYQPQSGGDPGQNFHDPMWPWDGSARPVATAPWSSTPDIVTPADVVDHRALGYFYDTIDPECRPIVKRFVKDGVKEVIKDVKDAQKEHKDISKDVKEHLKEHFKESVKEFKELEKVIKDKDKEKDLVEGGKQFGGEGQHFIPPELRPDLTRSALSSEPAMKDMPGMGGAPAQQG